MGEYPKAVLDYTAAMALDPDNPLAYQERARAYRALGDKENAERDERSVQAVTYLEQALAEMQQENWDQALWVLNQVLQLDPNLHRGYLRRAMVYLAKHEPDRAIADCNYIIEKLPRPKLDWGPVFGAYVDAFANRGNAHRRKGDLQKAIADYTEAIRLEPKLAPVYQERAEVYRALGETNKAARDERKAQELGE
jgi:tetratricopeptide (TPR) repeat protein